MLYLIFIEFAFFFIFADWLVLEICMTLLISFLRLSIRIWKFTRHSFFFFSYLFTGKHCFSRSAIFIAAIADGCSTVLRQRFRWNEPTLFLWSVDHRFAVQLRSRSGICLSIVHGTLFFMIHSVFLMLFHKATDYVFVHLFCLFFPLSNVAISGCSIFMRNDIGPIKIVLLILLMLFIHFLR